MGLGNLFKYGFWSIPESKEYNRIASIPYRRGSTDCDYKAVLYSVVLKKAGIQAGTCILRGRKEGHLETSYHAVVRYSHKGKVYFADLTGVLGGRKFKKIPDNWTFDRYHDELAFAAGYITNNGPDQDISEAFDYLKTEAKGI